jgi:hypothetical protein
MSISTRQWLYLSLLCIALTHCDNGNGKDPILVADVEKEFDVKLWEVLKPNERYLQLQISTIKDKDCLNYGIDQSLKQNGPNLELNINKILAPEVCQRGIGPAKSTLDLKTLTQGRFNLTVNLGKVVPSKGSITITASAFSFYMPEQYGFRLTKTTLYRVPEQTIWGYVAYTEGNKTAADQFIQELVKISRDAGLERGYYGYFEVNESNSLEFPVLNIDKPILAFARNYTDTDPKLEALIKNFRSKYPQVLQISINNNQGKAF